MINIALAFSYYLVIGCAYAYWRMTLKLEGIRKKYPGSDDLVFKVVVLLIATWPFALLLMVWLEIRRRWARWMRRND